MVYTSFRMRWPPICNFAATREYCRIKLIMPCSRLSQHFPNYTHRIFRSTFHSVVFERWTVKEAFFICPVYRFHTYSSIYISGCLQKRDRNFENWKIFFWFSLLFSIRFAVALFCANFHSTIYISRVHHACVCV